LMRGGERHAALAGQRFVREAVTRPMYLLYDLGAYPGLVRAGRDGRAVHGELYEVERGLIPRLDEMEGAPTEYRLEAVEVEGEGGPVFAYLYQLPTAALKLIEGGRWAPP